MSDLGKLFHLCAAGSKPLENFTTAALAIAIRHDDRPIKIALQGLRPPEEGVTLPRIGAPRTVAAETQVTLWPGPGELGYLDLVLQLEHQDGDRSEVWVEVKVDAPQSGIQLKNYRLHADVRSPAPVIITLGRQSVDGNVPYLTWSDIARAIEAVPDCHYTWGALRDFLFERRIARQGLVIGAADTPRLIEVLLDVNCRIRALWPDAGSALAWSDGTLRRRLTEDSKAKDGQTGADLWVTAGLLRFGFVSDGSAWLWQLGVGTSSFSGVRFTPEHVLRQTRELGVDWSRHVEAPEVLRRRLSAELADNHEVVVAWFERGLRELHTSGIVDVFLSADRARQTAAAERSRAKDLSTIVSDIRPADHAHQPYTINAASGSFGTSND